uniref:Uncharacterized protein LOC114328053 n=1 Tax=Diabrotica virgifera virgifera TaxID=50390 RepID=A0A6P7F9R9_DIAVI
MSGESVYLYAYDLEPNIWHLSVVVFKKGYSFGAGGFSETRPGISGFPDKRIFMGTTEKYVWDLSDFLRSNRSNWMQMDYNVLTKNSEHFAQALLDYLEIYKRIPSFLRSSRSMGYVSKRSGFSRSTENSDEIDWTKVIVGSIAAVATVARAAIEISQEVSQRNKEIKNQSVEIPTTYKYPYKKEKPTIEEIYDPPNNSAQLVTYRNNPIFPSTNQDKHDEPIEKNKKNQTDKDGAEKDKCLSSPDDKYSNHILIDRKVAVIIFIVVPVVMSFLVSFMLKAIFSLYF